MVQQANFIYFSPQTTGKTGKAIKIDKNLFLPFFCGVDPKTYEGQFIINQIEQLRTAPDHHTIPVGNAYRAPDHTQQLQNFKNAREHMLRVKSAQIIYQIKQGVGDGSPTVYITQIRITNKGDNQAPGFYSRNKIPGGGRGPIQKMKDVSLKHRTVYINGLSDSIDEAMKQAGNQSNVLFYNPARVCNDLGIWSSAPQTYITKNAVKELTKGLEDHKGDPVNWLVEGEGGGVLNEALKNMSGTLTGHNFKITNPKTNTPKLLKAITEKKGNLPKMFLSYTDSEVALIAAASHKEALAQQIGLLPCDKEMRNKIVATIDEKSSGVSPLTKQASRLSSKSITFVQALNNAGIYRK